MSPFDEQLISETEKTQKVEHSKSSLLNFQWNYIYYNKTVLHIKEGTLDNCLKREGVSGL